MTLLEFVACMKAENKWMRYYCRKTTDKRPPKMHERRSKARSTMNYKITFEIVKWTKLNQDMD